MIALVSPQCLTPRASPGRSIYDLSKNICPTTRRNIPLLRLVSRWQLQLPRLPRRIPGARGVTALQWAAQRGHAAVVEQLISAGATVDAAADGLNHTGRGPGRVFGSQGVLGVVSRCSLDLFFWWFLAWSQICPWNCDCCTEQILTANFDSGAVRYFHCQW